MDNVSPTFKGLRILLKIVSGLTPISTGESFKHFQTYGCEESGALQTELGHFLSSLPQT